MYKWIIGLVVIGILMWLAAEYEYVPKVYGVPFL